MFQLSGFYYKDPYEKPCSKVRELQCVAPQVNEGLVGVAELSRTVREPRGSSRVGRLGFLQGV